MSNVPCTTSPALSAIKLLPPDNREEQHTPLLLIVKWSPILAFLSRGPARTPCPQDHHTATRRRFRESKHCRFYAESPAPIVLTDRRPRSFCRRNLTRTLSSPTNNPCVIPSIARN